MQCSFYDSPHGLMNKSNFSSAEDQAALVNTCMRIPIFRRVVGTVTFETESIVDSKKKDPTKYVWENTNKLLGKLPGLIGCKTGITNAAGPCFAGYFEDPGSEIKLALILCHSETMQDRWTEIELMVDWAKKEIAL